MKIKYDKTEYITIEDVQRILGIGRNTAYKLIKSKKIKGTKAGGRSWKTTLEALDQYMNEALNS